MLGVVKMYIYFDNEKEYIINKNAQISSKEPLGTSFIDLLSIDFHNNNPIVNLPDNNFFIKELSPNGCLTNKYRIAIITYYCATDYVLNIDNKYLSDKDILTRYYLYQNYAKDPFTKESINMQYIAVPINGTVKPINNEHNNGHNTLNASETVSDDFQAKLIEVYTVNNIEEALYISFLKMVYNKVQVKKCACCHRYFILTGRSDTEYCNRIAPNSTKTCSEIGAIKKYHEKANKDPIKREYQKMYKRIHSWVKLKKITQNQFLDWSDRSRKIRDMAQEENWNLQKFIEEINNLEV
jgi:hypothetical protein